MGTGHPYGKDPPTAGHAMLSPRHCADIIGVSADYIIGEINDGRLLAHKREYGSGRTRYRIDAADCATYIARYWPKKDRRKIMKEWPKKDRRAAPLAESWPR